MILTSRYDRNTGGQSRSSRDLSAAPVALGRVLGNIMKERDHGRCHREEPNVVPQFSPPISVGGSTDDRYAARTRRATTGIKVELRENAHLG